MKKPFLLNKEEREMRCILHWIETRIPLVDKYIEKSSMMNETCNHFILHIVDKIHRFQNNQLAQLQGKNTISIDDDDYDRIKALQQELDHTIKELCLQKQDWNRLISEIEYAPEAWFH
jgi:hypothetical protein